MEGRVGDLEGSSRGMFWKMPGGPGAWGPEAEEEVCPQDGHSGCWTRANSNKRFQAQLLCVCCGYRCHEEVCMVTASSPVLLPHPDQAAPGPGAPAHQPRLLTPEHVGGLPLWCPPVPA